MAGRAFWDTAPAKGARAVTPHDTNVLTGGTCRALYIGGAGAVAATLADGTTATFAAVPVGTTLNVQARIVLSTGTTATNILALY